MRKTGVTQADLDATVKQMTGELYHTQNLSGFRFSSAATANLPTTGNPAVELDPPLDRAGHDAPDRSADPAASAPAPARPEPGRAGHGSGGPKHP